ncbi:hypothetical protein C8F04DRAFT_57121 [Mycena alexandri]|uniref:F-box domain-containing protein n=1 Tax=Mycena alexandri TaxID=1745969 RepID=A0AAD6XCF5_9AGAR|nr:hypothetical protein C8F04DRAFT_57121 [Mycena alexandri]
MPDWLSLPVEIWLHTLDLQPLRHLTALCLTCSQLLTITRPILYRHLYLTSETKNRTPNAAVDETFGLLARHPNLAQSVRELTLDSRSDSESYVRNPGLLDADSLRNMTQLKRVTIIGDVSRRAGRQEMANFIQILHDLRLDELQIPAPGARAFLLALSSSQLVQLANPKRIAFYVGPDRSELLLSRFSILLTAAGPSITSLSLTAAQTHLNALFILRFPALHSLEITNPFDLREITCPRGFNSFLSAHHEPLKHLHLGYVDRRDTGSAVLSSAAIVFDEFSGLHPTFLPNLQTFHGHYRNVEMMARARVQSLAGLRELSIGAALSPPSETIPGVQRMLNAMDAAGRLDALTVLDFDLFQWDDVELETASTFVRRWAALCGPTLEVWRGLLPFTGSWPLNDFAAFPRLRVIHFPKDYRLLNIAARLDLAVDVSQYIGDITSICNALEEVKVIGDFVDGSFDKSWMIDRRSPSGTALRQVE